MSCEVICCEIPKILQAIVEDYDEKFLAKLFSFLSREEKLDNYLAGYFEKILEMLFRRMTVTMMRYFNTRGLELLRLFLCIRSWQQHVHRNAHKLRPLYACMIVRALSLSHTCASARERVRMCAIHPPIPATPLCSSTLRRKPRLSSPGTKDKPCWQLQCHFQFCG